MKLVLELPSRAEVLQQNRLRWAEVLADQTLVDLPFRVETNCYGVLLMTPPPSGHHSSRQGEIAFQLRSLLGGHALPECPTSTLDGVRAADVGWYSSERFALVKGQIAFETAPEICVEVLSPSNTDSEMAHKKQLYFEAGAEEVWYCRMNGAMEFYSKDKPDTPIRQSNLCPNFPPTI
jgi:Uma2 family endonuclease